MDVINHVRLLPNFLFLRYLCSMSTGLTPGEGGGKQPPQPLPVPGGGVSWLNTPPLTGRGALGPVPLSLLSKDHMLTPCTGQKGA